MLEQLFRPNCPIDGLFAYRRVTTSHEDLRSPSVGEVAPLSIPPKAPFVLEQLFQPNCPIDSLFAYPRVTISHERVRSPRVAELASSSVPP